jgi:hypothetical protein
MHFRILIANDLEQCGERQEKNPVEGQLDSYWDKFEDCRDPVWNQLDQNLPTHLISK